MRINYSWDDELSTHNFVASKICTSRNSSSHQNSTALKLPSITTSFHLDSLALKEKRINKLAQLSQRLTDISQFEDYEQFHEISVISSDKTKFQLQKDTLELVIINPITNLQVGLHIFNI